MSWIFPIEITVRAPLMSAPGQAVSRVVPAAARAAVSAGVSERGRRPSDDFSDRDGYEPGFIPGHVVPLPKLSAAQRQAAARNLSARSGDDPFELPYHHFSVVVNGRRKLAFFTACNIDGRRSKYINRDTGAIAALDPRNPDHGLMESLEESGAEASEAWYDDARLAAGTVAGKSTYEKQVVPGFPDTQSMNRTLRMFQRGHLVRRLDPAWGTNDQAKLGEGDTFFFTNCAPQVGFFNMGRANPSVGGTGGGKLWRAVENLVLRNARNERMRACTFSGPIFDDDDRAYRDIWIPGQFFKVAVWAEGGALRSLGMIADQTAVIEVWPEALFPAVGAALAPAELGPEAFQDPDELDRVDDFLTTIEAIEKATHLDFGDAVRDADIRRGESAVERPERLEDVPMTPGEDRPPRRGRASRSPVRSS
jgi:endonuclease G